MEVEEALLLRVGDAIPEEDEPPSLEEQSHATRTGYNTQHQTKSAPIANQQLANRGKHTPPLKKPTFNSNYPSPRNATTKQLVNSMLPCSE